MTAPMVVGAASVPGQDSRAEARDQDVASPAEERDTDGASPTEERDTDGASPAEAWGPDGASPQEAAVLVIGYGNGLRADDGVGPAIAQRLAADPRAADARVLAVRQLTPDFALDIAQCSLVVLVDATVELEPGVVAVRELFGDDRGTPDSAADDTRVRGGGVRSAGSAAFTHHVAPLALIELAATLYGAHPRVVVVRVGARSLAFGDGLSAEVAAAVPRAIDAIADLIGDHRIRATSSDQATVARQAVAPPTAPPSGGRQSTRPSGRSPQRSRA